MRILTFTSLFPNSVQPNHAIFVKHRMEAVQEYCNAQLRVVAPVPLFPDLPFFEKWSQFARIPKVEKIGVIKIHHPRYVVVPKVGMTTYGLAMFLGSLSTVRRIHQDFPFDIIDAHYVYPDGLAAILLGKLFNKPVVLSARGTDINLYPQLLFVKPLIKKIINHADHLISVCGSLRDIMIQLGATENRVTVIPNGIDRTNFFMMDQGKARKELGLGAEKKILLTVGALIERKGIHLLVDALAKLHRAGKIDFETYIIGRGEYRDRLEREIARQCLGDWVRLVGEVPNDRLVVWYNAADLFFLGSSREGWPNVVSEALACGTPAVATAVNGTPEIIISEDYGLIVDRTPDSFADGLVTAFAKKWDSQKIHSYGQSRSWEVVAREVYQTFEGVLSGAAKTDSLYSSNVNG